MTIDQIKAQLAQLSFELQGELAAYLIQLRNAQDPDYKKTISERLDDKDPKHWLTPDEFERRLDAS